MKFRVVKQYRVVEDERNGPICLPNNLGHSDNSDILTGRDVEQFPNNCTLHSDSIPRPTGIVLILKAVRNISPKQFTLHFTKSNTLYLY